MVIKVLVRFLTVVLLAHSFVVFSVTVSPPLAQAQTALRVAYLIPGSNKEPFWLSAASFAQAAADDLGFILEVHYVKQLVKIMSCTEPSSSYFVLRSP